MQSWNVTNPLPVLLTIPVGLYCLFVIFLNGLTIVVVCKCHDFRDSLGACIICLAIGDGLMGLLRLSNALIHVIIGFPVSLDYCYVDSVLELIFGSWAAGDLLVMVMDRFLSVRFPLRYHSIMTTCRVTAVCVLMHLFRAGCMGILVMFLDKEQVYYVPYSLQCLPSPFSIIMKFASVFLTTGFTVSSLCLVGLYIIARNCNQRMVNTHIVAFKKASNSVSVSETPERDNSLHRHKSAHCTRSNARIVKTLILINLAFYMCYAPWWTVYIVFPMVTKHKAPDAVLGTIAWASALASLINPLVYIPTLSSFRKQLYMLFCKKKCIKQERSRSSQ